MSTTPHYDSEHLQPNSSDPEVPLNTALDTIERAANAQKEWTITGDVQPTKAQMAEGIFHQLNGTPSAPFAFGVPAVGRFFILRNNTGKVCTVYVQGLSGSGVAVNDGETHLLHCDGTDVESITASSGAASFSGAMVRKAADQTGANYSGAGSVIAWDQEVYDTDGYHDTVTNNSRFTIPVGGDGKYVVNCSIRTSSATGNEVVQLAILKNGSAIFDGACGVQSMVNASTPTLNIASGPIPLVAGDYVEAHMFFSADTSIDVSATRSNFSIQKVDDSIS